ncbi:zeta toxin family protein [Campylobacter sp. JMF_06 NA1]|uniref:zeta toxin family protein n=1 Tax=Campylobacter sp. JMF_06 NA1 TaxID=2983823 RepID=UPI0022E9FC6F|nr:zeta toxin family protein [Campylobacter sp. JMF_06 NA1]MDA3077759.1 zeta toxin family protein [Campylobacter sp. JMF_06 NA1]
MASLMQRDVLLEYACVGHLFPADRDEKMRSDSKKMGEIYHQILMSEHESIDFEKTAEKIEQIREEYDMKLMGREVSFNTHGLFLEFFAEKLREIYGQNLQNFFDELEEKFAKFDILIRPTQDKNFDYHKFYADEKVARTMFLSKYDMSDDEIKNVLRNIATQMPNLARLIKSIDGGTTTNFATLQAYKDKEISQNLLCDIAKINENAEFFAQRASQNVWAEVILDKNPLAKAGNEAPKAYVLGGQPGAGKANMLRLALNELGENGVVINGDEFRKYHPYYAQICALDSQKMAERTAEFCAKLTEIIINKAIVERYNIAIEGTFRTADTPIYTLKKFKTAGYKTEVLIQTCDGELSWKSCNERYEIWKKLCPQEARYVVQSHHDLVVSKLNENLKIVQDSGFADNIRVFTRE